MRSEPKLAFRLFRKDLAATYSRGSYTTTTIGKAEFDGRVRDGNGSDLSFMTTKKILMNMLCSLKTTYSNFGKTIRELNRIFLKRKSNQAARPISISPLKGLLLVHA